MKLIKCNVENFGKISKEEIKFDDNLTIFKRENGWGKTTLSVFIKAMLYGFDKNTKEKAERQKYMPWNKGKYGGNLELEIKGTKYRIERFFGETPKGDKFTLTNLETNKEDRTYTERIGEEIFKLDKESFEKSIYIPQQEIEVEISNDLTTKLTNLDTIQDDMNKYEEAHKKLSKKSEQLKKEIKNIESEISEEETKINKCEETEKILKIYEEKYKEIKEEQEKEKNEINNLEEKIKMANEQQLKEEIEKQYKKLKEEEEESKILYKEMQSFFKNGVPKRDEIANIENAIIMLKKSKEEIKQKREYSNLEEKEIEKKQEEYNNYKEKDEKIREIEINKRQKENLIKDMRQNKNNIIFILAIIILLAGISSIFLIKEKTISAIIIVVGIILFFIQIKIILKNKKIEKVKKEIKKDEEKIIRIKEEKEEEKKEFFQYINKYEKKYNEKTIYEDLLRIKLNYEDYRKAQLIVEKIKPQIEQFLYQYFGVIIEDYNKYLDQIKIKMENYPKIETTYKKAMYNVEIFLRQYSFEKIEKNGTIEEKTEDMQEKLQNIKNRTNITIQNIASIEKKMEELSTIVDEKAEIEEELEALKVKILQIGNRKNIIDKTIEILAKTKEKLSSKYLQAMNWNLNKYIKLLAENSNITDKTIIDIDLNTNIEVDGEKKNIEAFSAGYKDLIGICTRLALIDSIFEDEVPFLIFDDPFVNLDEEKVRNAVSLIKEISNKYQIIYFACHESRT